MAWVNPRIAQRVARQKGVKLAVRAQRDRIANEAKALFAAHDNPGGHRITVSSGKTDGFVNLEGPAPLSVELGHWQDTSEGPEFVEGLHVLGRAVGQATE